MRLDTITEEWTRDYDVMLYKMVKIIPITYGLTAEDKYPSEILAIGDNWHYDISSSITKGSPEDPSLIGLNIKLLKKRIDPVYIPLEDILNEHNKVDKLGLILFSEFREHEADSLEKIQKISPWHYKAKHNNQTLIISPMAEMVREALAEEFPDSYTKS